MIDGMFRDTMVNMNWTDVQDHVDRNALVLLPVGVIEEHGPHLCLGTDIYIAHIQSIFVKQRLEKEGFPVAIAPPFYWGICQSTGTFIGSFRIRKETAKALLFDIMASLAEFGFKSVYTVNAHGDIEQRIVLIEACRDAAERLEINACCPILQNIVHHYGLEGDEPYICPIKPQTVSVSASEYADVHGGDIETATMNHFYPELTDIEKAKSLPPVELSEDKIMTWAWGGSTKQLSSAGYLGAPADFGSVQVMKNVSDIAYRVSEAILDHMARADG
jgi:creatinine amidohydrolase